MGTNQKVSDIFSHIFLSDLNILLVQNARKVEYKHLVGNCHMTMVLSGFTWLLYCEFHMTEGLVRSWIGQGWDSWCHALWSSCLRGVIGVLSLVVCGTGRQMGAFSAGVPVSVLVVYVYWCCGRRGISLQGWPWTFWD